MGLAAAFGQLLVMGIILGGGALYTRHHVATLQRADFHSLDYIEDSKAGNGSRYRVITRAAETGGASYTVEVLGRGTAVGFVQEFAASVPAHEHANQEEELVVKAGKLGYTRGGSIRDRGIAGPGTTITIPKGTSHSLFNADNSTDVLYEVTHRPAGPLGEAFFESLAGLGWDYGSLDRVHPLQVLVLHDAADTLLTDLPSFLQPAVKHVLVPLAHLLGFKAVYPSHVSAGGGQVAAAGAAADASSEQEQPAAQEAPASEGDSAAAVEDTGAEEAVVAEIAVEEAAPEEAAVEEAAPEEAATDILDESSEDLADQAAMDQQAEEQKEEL